MKFLGLERKEKKIKGAMFKEVLKDNLRMAEKAGNNHRPQRKKKKLVIISSASFLAILIYFLANNFAFLEQTHSQDIRSRSFKPGVYSRQSDLESKKTGGSNLVPPHYTTFLRNLQMPLRRVFGLKVKKILIDPGHGGEDLGAVGKLGTKEKDITLDIARKLRERLKKHQGYQILMTREEDVTLLLEDRIEFANYCGADLFISIHINYIPNAPISIIETYYFGPHTDKEALLLAEKENKGTEYTLNDFKEIIQNIENTLKTQESKSLALFIQKSLYMNISKQNKNIKNWGLKTAPFIVLLGVNIPSVLTEVTCLSNINEEKKLNKEHYREEIARYLEEGIVSYLNKNKNIDKGGVMWSKKSL